MRPASQPLTWRPALDGLRALAVLSVMLYHFKTQPFLPGGLIGVDVFFVLSGFLISTILFNEWSTTGNISLYRFYVRRLLRLLPAALACVGIYLAVVIVFSGWTFVGGLTGLDGLKNAGYFVTYLYSWGVALGGVTPGGFNHLWSLSVEEQYYLLWPVLLLLLLRGGARVPCIMLLAGSLAFASAAIPLLLHEPTWNRVYFGADYRAHSLLIGSMVGLAYAGGYIRRVHTESVAFRAVLYAAVGYLLAVLCLATAPRILSFYQLGIPLVSLSAVVVIAGAVFVDGGIWLKALGNQGLIYVGRRSYAIYLWHYPIGYSLRSLDTLPQLLLACGLTFLAAELSHQLVERPASGLRSRLQEGFHLQVPWARRGVSSGAESF